MIQQLIAIALLVWLPVLFYVICRRGYVLILGWLFIAPLALYVLDALGQAPVVEVGAREGAKTQGGGYLVSETNVRARELLDPTRLIFAGFLVMFMVETALKRKRLGRLDTIEKFACMFSVVLIASALFRSNRTAFALRVASDAFIIPFVAYFVTRRLVTSEWRLRQVFKLTAYMGSYVLVFCFVERLLATGLYYRVGGPFNQPNALIVVMSIIFLIALSDLLGGWSIPGKRDLLPDRIRNMILYLAPVAVALTWARATWLAFLCSVTVFVLVHRRFLPRSLTLLAIGLALTIIPLITASLTTTVLEQILKERVTDRSSTIYARIGAWTIITNEYGKSPLFGIGLNNLRDVLDAQRVYIQGVKSETHAHNSFLTILAEQGAVGFLLYLGIVTSVLHMGRRLYKAARSYREALCGAFVLAMMTAYLVVPLFTNALQIPTVHHVYVYSFTGAIFGVYARRTSNFRARVVSTTKTGRREQVSVYRPVVG